MENDRFYWKMIISSIGKRMHHNWKELIFDWKMNMFFLIENRLLYTWKRMFLFLIERGLLLNWKIITTHIILTFSRRLSDSIERSFDKAP